MKKNKNVKYNSFGLFKFKDERGYNRIQAVDNPPKGEYEGDYKPVIEPSDNQRIVQLIVGDSGSGKTTLAVLIASYFREILNLPVYVIVPDSQKNEGVYPKGVKYVNLSSMIEEDPEYKKKLDKYNEAKIKFKYLKKTIEDPMEKARHEINISKMKPVGSGNGAPLRLSNKYYELIKKPSLFIYDDTEDVNEKKILHELLHSQLNTGRHNGINMVIIKHIGNDNTKSTREILNESNVITLLGDYTPHQRSYFTNKYLTGSKEIKEKFNDIQMRDKEGTILKYSPVIASKNELIIY